MAVLGGAAPSNLWQIPITYSQDWVPPANGTAIFHLIGAGGAGDGNGGSGNAGGGGAGGYARKSYTVTTSQSYAIAIGAGGLGSGNATGGNGGHTTVTLTGVGPTITANGGTGGSGSAAGTGGAASNGDVNRTGGNGGLTSGGCGGAVGIYTNGEGAANNYAGSSDVQSPFMSPSYGFLSGGGRGGKTTFERSGGEETGPMRGENGEFLAGGGGVHTRNGYYAQQMAGFGGIGGGGGGA